MPSDRRLAGNQRNAACGGPSTDKARVRLDARERGYTAGTLVLPGENAAALKQLRDDLFAEYEPAGPTELLLFEEFVRCSWRLLRMRRVETEMWTGHIIALRTRQGAGRDVTEQESDRAVAATLAETPAAHLVNFFRYERMTTRDFYRVLDKLESVQRTRRRAKVAASPETAAEPADKSGKEPQPPLADGCLPLANAVSDSGIGTVSPPPPPPPKCPKDRAA